MEGKVKTLFERIELDPKHHDVVAIGEQKNSECLFNEWSMGTFHEYGQNGASARLKLKQTDGFFTKSDALSKPNVLAVPFFANVRDILFKQ